MMTARHPTKFDPPLLPSIIAIACFLALTTRTATAQVPHTFTMIYSFRGAGLDDGGDVAAGVVLDTAGNLYGTTAGGGSEDCGTIYKIDPSGNESVLYEFTQCSPVGGIPYGRLIRDQAGNLYGTTEAGGPLQFGSVFVLSSAGVFTSLYNFRLSPDGRYPYAGVSRDAAGNLYGADTRGGTFNLGTVFVIDSAGNETVLHDFTGGADGAVPYGDVIRDSSGNLYGTASQGGSGFGTVYKIDGAGQFSTLYTFPGGAAGGRPFAGLVRDSAGNLYGTTSNFGDNAHQGTIFKLDTAGNATVLYNFDQGGGRNPVAGLARDSSGNLYGTALSGGDFDWGTVFVLRSTGNFKVLHHFTGKDGKAPQGRVALDGSGNLYGTTYLGGPSGWGTVFKLGK
jgi:uncharacterized repeat protein (TIGR03803 family)